MLNLNSLKCCETSGNPVLRKVIVSSGEKHSFLRKSVGLDQADNLLAKASGVSPCFRSTSSLPHSLGLSSTVSGQLSPISPHRSGNPLPWKGEISQSPHVMNRALQEAALLQGSSLLISTVILWAHCSHTCPPWGMYRLGLRNTLPALGARQKKPFLYLSLKESCWKVSQGNGSAGACCNCQI